MAFLQSPVKADSLLALVGKVTKKAIRRLSTLQLLESLFNLAKDCGDGEVVDSETPQLVYDALSALQGEVSSDSEYKKPFTHYTTGVQGCGLMLE